MGSRTCSRSAASILTHLRRRLGGNNNESLEAEPNRTGTPPLRAKGSAKTAGADTAPPPTARRMAPIAQSVCAER